MGKSTTALTVTDDQIRDFIKKPSRLETLIKETVASDRHPRCDLFDWWAVINYAITGGASNAPLPLSAIRRGDVYFGRGLSDPAHAIYSATVKALSEKLSEITESSLRTTIDARDLTTPVYPRRYWKSETLADDEEFRGLLQKFREFVAKAAAENMGMVFSRYEDL